MRITETNSSSYTDMTTLALQQDSELSLFDNNKDPPVHDFC